MEARLSQLRPEVPWDVKNQAAVHLWYGTRFGVGAVSSLDSVAEAVATWPETATAVAVRHDAGRLVVVAPCGLGDLLNGVWRWNPGRATVADFCRRLAAKDVARRWPRVRVEVPSTTSAYAAAG